MKILVVDDSQTSREKLEEVLSGAGYSVTTAPDGMQGLEIIRREEFDLLFLDIDMPNLSGLQVLRMLRNEPRFSEFPIIMLSARDTKQDEYWGIETGATAYMKKPFKTEALLEKVGEILKISEKETGSQGAGARQSEHKAGEDVIFKAGDIQEKQLFKMSLINKIHQITTSQLDLKETCARIEDIFSSVIEFDIATLLLSDEERIKMYVYVRKPITSKFFFQTRQNMKEEFAARVDLEDPQWDNVDVEVVDPERLMPSDNGSNEIAGFHAVTLESTGDRFGVFTMARGGEEFSRDEIETCNSVATQSALVINSKRMYEKIKRFAVMDGLTGLYNHRYFQEQLEKEFSRARRFNLSLSMIMLDIDNFKNVNDTYGHQQGDVILKGVSMLMRRCVRDIDLVARYGGEEFAVILPETPKKNATVVAERIREMVERHEFQRGDGTYMSIKASLGVSGHPDDDIDNRMDLIAKADEALYRAKREGRNRVCLYSPERNDF